ncbi:MAG TPA: hypothetical protein VGI39_37015, partial [Polyangiaceae bacterium]
FKSKDPGLMEIDARLKGTTSFDEVIGAIQAALDGAGRGELTPERIESARDHLLNQAILGLQTPAQVATALAVSAGATGDVATFEKYLSALAAVKPADVARIAKTLTPAHRDVVTLMTGPEAPEKPEKNAKPVAAKGASR